MIADDHNLLRTALVSFIETYSNTIQVIGQASDGMELVRQIEKRLPDVVIVDLIMPVLNGQETLLVLKHKFPTIKIIIMSMDYDKFQIESLIKLGANGFLPKNCYADDLFKAVEDVYRTGEIFRLPGYAK